MKKTLLFDSVVFLAFVCSSFAADKNQNDANGLLTVGDYLQYAIQHNAGLKASYEMAVAADEQIPQAKSLPDPQLSYGYATEPTPQRKMFEVMQMFPWFGTLDLRADAASAMAM